MRNIIDRHCEAAKPTKQLSVSGLTEGNPGRKPEIASLHFVPFAMTGAAALFLRGFCFIFFLYLSGFIRAARDVALFYHHIFMSETLEQKMCKRSLGYSFVRNVFVRPLLYLSYRKVNVVGASSVPDTGPVIFAPNHQNALMDALAILCTKDRQPVFVARADIFRRPAVIAILHFLRILPIYRKRDGGSSSDNNRETFDIIQQVLLDGRAVGIMPEGTHNEFKRLQVLQKGIFRLAMQVQEQYGNRPGVKIIPVGIEYGNTGKFRSSVMVNYGRAIEMSDFYDLYAENPAKAFKLMQDILSEKMREGMIDIRNERHYRAIERIRVYYRRRAGELLGLSRRNAGKSLLAQQKIIAAVQDFLQRNPESGADLCARIERYTDIIESRNISDRAVERQPYSLLTFAGGALLALAGLPVCLAGILLNYLPHKLSDIGSRRVKDPQFVSSVRFVLGLVLFPVYHLLITVLIVIFVPCIWGKLAMPLLLIPLGLFAYEYSLFVRRLCERWLLRKGVRTKNAELSEAGRLRKSIFEDMDKIIVG